MASWRDTISVFCFRFQVSSSRFRPFVLSFQTSALLGWLALVLFVLAGEVPAMEAVSRPFVGVTHIVRSETKPRPLRMHLVDLDLAAPGLRFRLTPPAGPNITRKETTLQFLIRQRAQLAINAHFFEPWPPPDPDPGTATLVGLAAADGQVYAPFLEHPPKAFAIRPNAPALNMDASNRVTIVHRRAGDAGGYAVAEPVGLYNALAGSEQILSNGVVTAADCEWNNRLDPRTAIGVTTNRHCMLFTVDGRQPGRSEGLSVGEVARLLRDDYGVTDALSLDGGGSTTLAIADPVPRVVNVPVGLRDTPGTERPVGSNLAIFATHRAERLPPTPQR